jgi:hypothetical protein
MNDADHLRPIAVRWRPAIHLGSFGEIGAKKTPVFTERSCPIGVYL